MILLVGIVAGMLLPIQTSVNSKFGSKVGSPYLATVNSLVGGMLFLMVMGLLTRHRLLIPLSFLFSHPWWLYLGGITGAFAFTSNILLLPRLGAVQTVVMPLLGQIVMSMLVDEFGWFNLPRTEFNGVRFLGVLALLTGVALVIYRKSPRVHRRQAWPWQILGVMAGFALAIQTSSNGALGRAMASPVTAGIFSLLSGAIIMAVVVELWQRNLSHLVRALGRGNRWWIWLGGPIGSVYIFSSLTLAPLIGAGTTIVLTILGNVAGGVLIDKYGLIGTPKRKIRFRQYFGLLVMIVGVILIKLF